MTVRTWDTRERTFWAVSTNYRLIFHDFGGVSKTRAAFRRHKMAGPRLGVSPIALPTPPPAVHGTPRKPLKAFILASLAALAPSLSLLRSYTCSYIGRMHTVKITTLITHFRSFASSILLTVVCLIRECSVLVVVKIVLNVPNQRIRIFIDG